jgi:hypothetical protein
MLDLSSKLSDLPVVRGSAPWPDHEHVKGWGVFGLPFDSGHVLALRVFPEYDFAPYRTLWHRDPNGSWSIHVDGPRLDTACPRSYATWRPRSLVRARERMAHGLGMGHLEMSGVMPSGHAGTLMPQQMYFVDDSRATLGGVDLGRPVHLNDNPMIGGVALPARGILAIGQGVWEILDHTEYERTRSETAQH